MISYESEVTLPLTYDLLLVIGPIIAIFAAIAAGYAVSQISKLIGLANPVMWAVLTAIIPFAFLVWLFQVRSQLLHSVPAS